MTPFWWQLTSAATNYNHVPQIWLLPSFFYGARGYNETNVRVVGGGPDIVITMENVTRM